MTKIVSGGQTGVDRAALDFALQRGTAHGGWCPKGRRAADGTLDARYQLTETESAGYRQRTKRNVLDSDGTLIVNIGELTGGSLATLQFAQKGGRPVLVVQVDTGAVNEHAAAIREWLAGNEIHALNVAGPREDKCPGLYRKTFELLMELDRLAPWNQVDSD